MAKKPRKSGPTQVDSIKHKDARTNIPMQELRGFVATEEERPPKVLYPRDPSLDPQLVWKGKDEQDAHPLDVPAVPRSTSRRRSTRRRSSNCCATRQRPATASRSCRSSTTSTASTISRRRSISTTTISTGRTGSRTTCNGESFFVRHAYFTGASEPYEKLKRALRAEIDEGTWATLYSTVSRPFAPPDHGKIAVKVINHYGDEVLKVFEV